MNRKGERTPHVVLSVRVDDLQNGTIRMNTYAPFGCGYGVGDTPVTCDVCKQPVSNGTLWYGAQFVTRNNEVDKLLELWAGVLSCTTCEARSATIMRVLQTHEVIGMDENTWANIKIRGTAVTQNTYTISNANPWKSAFDAEVEASLPELLTYRKYHWEETYQVVEDEDGVSWHIGNCVSGCVFPSTLEDILNGVTEGLPPCEWAQCSCI